MYSVDIDVGGTLTDGLFSDGSRQVCAKVDTTAHDLTVCLFDCLTQGATQLGFAGLESFLEQVELLRWSTTITSNVLAELRGPKIGLIVSKGHERDLYGKPEISPILNKVVDGRNVLGIEHSGGPEILSAVRSLLEGGVRRICISLQGALQDPEKEQHIKRIIDEQYPDHFLGSVPVLTGSDICQNTDDMTRTYYAVINAYTHSALAATLFKAEDELRYTQGYSRAFLISHINGGVAGVSKTRAIDTMESGPILGIYGSSHLARAYGLKRVIALDVGGTTAKLGIIHDGEPVYAQISDLFGIPVHVSLPYLRSIALGGGSVVSLQGDAIGLGPESMGSFPGPVCYALGGDKPTLTDAFVTAGLIDPEYFLGGTKSLDLAAAREVVEKHIAVPRGTSVEDACQAVINRACDMVANMIATAAQELRQDLSDHVLFAYGGNGGLFACGVAERAGLKDVHLFALGPVFSAFGSSVSDISHVYERSFHLMLRDGADVGPLNRLVEEMRSAGIRDLLGEGIKPDGAECSVELELSRPGGQNLTVKCPQSHFASVSDLRSKLGSDLPAGDISLELVRVRVKKVISKPSGPLRELGPADASAAFLGKRKVSYGSIAGEAAIYKWESLQPGNHVEGCALVESANSTYFVPEGWRLEIDQHGNAQILRADTNVSSGRRNLQETQSHGKR
ncbi:MAG: hydantoinase/oxoprolinase family protein [Acidobacteriia bacterium]|nr:hydantoinase/oxoprolinase family protein [Terriglobia bacterium]